MPDTQQQPEGEEMPDQWPGKLVHWVNAFHAALPSWVKRFMGVTLFRYLLVGTSSLILDVSLFLLFHQTFGIPLLAANCLSLSVVITYAFILQKRFTFQVEGRTVQRFGFFVVQIGIAAALNNLLLYLFVKVLGWHPAIAKLVDTALVFFWNYTFSRLVVFRAGAGGVSDR